MQKTFKSTALVAAITLAFQVHAQQIPGPVDAGAGENVTVGPGTLTTISNYEDAFVAHDGGTIKASNVDITTSGLEARGVVAQGAGSQVELLNGSITTSGTEAAGLRAEGGSITTNGTKILTTNTEADGVSVVGNGSVELTGGSVRVTGDGASGLWAEDGLITADNVSITSTGIANGVGFESAASGVSTLDSGHVKLTGGSVTATGQYSFGLLAEGGLIETTNTNITTKDDNNPAANAYHGTVSLKGGEVVTEGLRSYGLSAMFHFSGLAGGDGGSVIADGTKIITTGYEGVGVYVDNDNRDTASTATLINGTTINASGMRASGIVAMAKQAHYASVTGSNLTVRAEDGAGAYLRGYADLNLTNSDMSSGDYVALYLDRLDENSTLFVGNSELRSDSTFALSAYGGSPVISLEQTTLRGAEGSLSADGATNFTVNADRASQLLGDVAAYDNATANISLTDHSSLEGATWQLTNGHIDLSLDATSGWLVTGDSTVRTLNNSGQIEFKNDGIYRTVRTTGNYQGGGGLNNVVTLHTELNVGGALSNQHTDRLLIEGNATGGTTLLNIDATGAGANTNVANDHQLHGNEGISVVQVGGNATKDSFKLRNGYVTVGNSPYQYRLFAYEGAAVDQSQKLLQDAPSVNWDYRLQTAYVDDGGNVVPGSDVDPPAPPAPSPAPSPTPSPTPPPPPAPFGPDHGRGVVTPQMTSYLTAPLALHAYQTMVNDGMRQRLGGIRQGENSSGSEFYLRQLADAGSYRSNLDFDHYGYDMRYHAQATQIGGNWLHLEGDAQDLRIGAAATFGTLRYTPTTFTVEHSQTDMQTRDWALTGTWQHANGWYADAIMSFGTYRGHVHTLNADRAGKLGANAFDLSLEAGRTFTMANGLQVEPSVRMQRENLSTSVTNDVDRMNVSVGHSGITLLDTGVRLAYPMNDYAATPYVRMAVSHAWGGAPDVSVGGTRFDTGAVGSAVKMAVGLDGQVSKHVSVYGEVGGSRRLGGYGMGNASGMLGVRADF